jgi:hypothetical protein
MIWTCAACNRSFKKAGQVHYCGDNSVDDFLKGKSEVALALFDDLIDALTQIGPVKLETTKSMIAVASIARFAYIIAIGETFIDVVLPFAEANEDNYCFRKIALVPGGTVYNHHLRLMYKEDLNEEVVNYLKKAYQCGKAI